METPDEALFEEDVASAEFRSGGDKGNWGFAAPEFTENFKWPRRLIWIAAAPRTNAPDRYYIALDALGYRTDPPTGTFWDPVVRTMLTADKRPKGKPDSRVSRVFRTDWNSGTAFYHPYDRVAASSHKVEWAEGATNDPRRKWTPEHTIVDWLWEFHGLLNCGDYIGI